MEYEPPAPTAPAVKDVFSSKSAAKLKCLLHADSIPRRLSVFKSDKSRLIMRCSLHTEFKATNGESGKQCTYFVKAMPVMNCAYSDDELVGLLGGTQPSTESMCVTANTEHTCQHADVNLLRASKKRRRAVSYNAADLVPHAMDMVAANPGVAWATIAAHIKALMGIDVTKKLAEGIRELARARVFGVETHEFYKIQDWAARLRAVDDNIVVLEKEEVVPRDDDAPHENLVAAAAAAAAVNPLDGAHAAPAVARIYRYKRVFVALACTRRMHVHLRHVFAMDAAHCTGPHR